QVPGSLGHNAFNFQHRQRPHSSLLITPKLWTTHFHKQFLGRGATQLRTARSSGQTWRRADIHVVVSSALPRDDWIKQGTTLVPAPHRRSSTGDHERPRPRPFGGRSVTNYTIFSPHMQAEPRRATSPAAGRETYVTAEPRTHLL